MSPATLVAYRERLQLSQQAFADALGLSQGLISAIEAGRRSVSRRLLRQLRSKGEEKTLRPSLAEFLAEQSGGPAIAEDDFKLPRPIPLENWGPTFDLRKPADPGASRRVFISSIPEDARAVRFIPAPALLNGDTIAIFKPCEFQSLVRNQIVLIQLRAARSGGLPANVAHLGRVIVSGDKRKKITQFEPALPTQAPVVTLHETDVSILMLITFRGRFCS